MVSVIEAESDGGRTKWRMLSAISMDICFL
jgi:hypothetical protein